MPVSTTVEPKFARRVLQCSLRSVAEKALRAERSSLKKGLTIVIVGDETIRQMNADFHGVDAATDVLSFPSDEEDYYGDIIISYETARANAHAAQWRTDEELELLVVHGVLHLLGYDDIDPIERERMWKRQGKILGKKIKS